MRIPFSPLPSPGIRRTFCPGRGDFRFVTALLALGLFSLYCLDHAVSGFLAHHAPHGEARHFLAAVSHFGTPFGQGIVLLGIGMATAWKTRGLTRIAVASWCGGLAPNVVKLLVSRTRPKHFEFDSLAISDSFVRWLPFGEGGSGLQSFPSAHTACGFAFAALMSWRYPGARWLFLTLAALVGVQRVTTLAHFPSDVCVGAGLGWGVGMLFVKWRPLAAFFDRMENSAAQPPLTGGKQATLADAGRTTSSAA